jgi:hypothetical protein
MTGRGCGHACSPVCNSAADTSKEKNGRRPGTGRGRRRRRMGVMILRLARGWNVAVIQFSKPGTWKTKVARQLGVDSWAMKASRGIPRTCPRMRRCPLARGRTRGCPSASAHQLLGPCRALLVARPPSEEGRSGVEPLWCGSCVCALRLVADASGEPARPCSTRDLIATMGPAWADPPGYCVPSPAGEP